MEKARNASIDRPAGGRGPLHRAWFPDGRSARDLPCDAPCAEKNRTYVLAATILASSMAFIDGTIVHIALPAIQKEFAADFGVLQWVVNGYALMLGALILIGGSLGDRFGRRGVFTFGIALFALASLFCALAPSPDWLIGGRVLQGLGAALMVPQSLAILSATFPKDVRGRAIGLWAGAAALTTAAGPILGGIMIDALSWRAIFWINLPLAAAAIALAFLFIPENKSGADSRPDWLGGMLIMVALAALIYALTVLPEFGAADPRVLGTAAAGLALAAAFLFVEQRATAPIMPLWMFRSPDFSVANAITLLLYFALGGVLFLLPYTLIQVYGYSSFEAGAALLPFGLLIGLLSGRAGALGDRHGPRWPLAVGALVAAIATGWFVLADVLDWTAYWRGPGPGIVLLAAGMTLVVAPLTTAVMNAAPDEVSGAASGINNAASRLAGVFAVAIMGIILLLVFEDRMTAALDKMTLTGEEMTAVEAQLQQLAELKPPDPFNDAAARQIESAVAQSYRAAYRTAMALAAVCAFLASGLAAIGLRKRSSGLRKK